MITLIITLALIVVICLLVLMVNYFINDYDQSDLADEYSKKAKQHNELMVRKESVPSSFKKESSNGSSSR